jgi:hypothetical protein
MVSDEDVCRPYLQVSGLEAAAEPVHVEAYGLGEARSLLVVRNEAARAVAQASGDVQGVKHPKGGATWILRSLTASASTLRVSLNLRGVPLRSTKFCSSACRPPVALDEDLQATEVQEGLAALLVVPGLASRVGPANPDVRAGYDEAVLAGVDLVGVAR